ncbi:hypothetical protein [Clostridium felsineum]|uniref:hypothetical protein n=1 Tax=Clostridium felsineum TaxID=36839 RepID=UPI00098C8BEB|nr:hypothetical protein [Clostridium felsineum]URZ00587.1 hypothetical protein CLAUR_005750 [Clostridium felsineum]
MKEFRYIYNVLQANFYVQHDIKLIEVGVGKKKDVYFKFKDGQELQKIFRLWMDRKAIKQA